MTQNSRFFAGVNFSISSFFLLNGLNCISSLNCDLTVSQLVSHSKGFKRSQELSEPFELDFLISSKEKLHQTDVQSR